MKLDEMMNALEITEYPKAELESIYHEAKEEYEALGKALVEPDNIIRLNQTYGVFTRYLDEVLEAAREVSKNPILLRWLYLLKHIQMDKIRAQGLITKEICPPSEEAAYHLCPIFPMLSFIPRIVNEMRRRKLPEDIIADTLSGFEDKITDYHDRYGVLGLKPYIEWLQHYINLDIIRVGRFDMQINCAFAPGMIVLKNQAGEYRIIAENVDIHKSGLILGCAGCKDSKDSFFAVFTETDTAFEGYPVNNNGLVTYKRMSFKKSEWSIALKAGDNTLNVHIPARKNLSKEKCEESYAYAKEIFRKYYPEYNYRAFMCISWMVDPQLKELIEHRTNLTDFLDRYLHFPRKSEGKSVINFAFFKPIGTPIEQLPEDTSLRRILKAHLQNGGRIYEQGGVFFD